MNVAELLRLMLKRNISDIHFKSNTPPIIRYNGKLIYVESNKLTNEQIKEIADSVLSEDQKKKFLEDGELDMSYSLENVSRFRVNLYNQRGTIALTLRVVPPVPKTFEELNLPVDSLKKIASHNRGVILMAGITGVGKTTTMNSIIDYINSTKSYNIITIEDPIEFYHNDKMSSVSQREVGVDTKSFAHALKHVLRQDPDVISIGEIRDFETVNAAIICGETGHLVLSTVHTVDTIRTLDRLIDMYPPYQQAQVRVTLSQILKAIISQRLLPRIDKEGRIPAVEILVVTPFVKRLILEGKDSEIYSAMQQGKYYGMQTFDQSLLELHEDGKIALQDALDIATNPDEMMLSIRGISSGIVEADPDS